MSYKAILDRLVGRGAAGRLTPLPGQVPNDAGGYVYPVDLWARLDRFLLLGTEDGTYYVGALELTRENARALEDCLAEDGPRVVERIVEISTAGRAPKNEPALFALALAAAAEKAGTRRAALDALPQVARTGTHLLHFADYVQAFRGWGRGLRGGFARWLDALPADRLALQAVKYGQRDGWTLRDILRLAHPETDDVARRALIDWIAHPDEPGAVARAREAYPLIDGAQRIRETDDPAAAADLIVRFSLPREAVPTGLLNDPAIWDALLVDMPMTAMLRNLGKMSAVGLLVPGSEAGRYVAQRLGDLEALRTARVHPMQLLIALKTYAGGRGIKGRLTWTPAAEVSDALDAAFDRSFGLIEGTGKRLLVAVDVSGSMAWAFAGSPALKAREAGGAMALQMLRCEPKAHVIAFDTDCYEPGLSRRQRLDDVLRAMDRWGGGTDLAQPILYAYHRRLEVEGFVVVTDNETWAGQVHAAEALAAYRREVNPTARIAVLATAANRGSVVDPGDALAFGACGFDASVPQLLADFLAA